MRRGRAPPSDPRRAAPRAAPSRGPRARARRARPARTYGGFETTRSNGPARQPVVQVLQEQLDVEAGERGVLARRATARPPRRRSATTRAPGTSSASASAIAPVPVPTSSTRGDRHVAQELDAALDDDLRLGPRHERALVAAKRQPAEPPLAEHVRERLARRARAEHERPDGSVVDLVTQCHEARARDAERRERRSIPRRPAATRSRARPGSPPRGRRSLERAPSLLCLQRLGEAAELAVDDLVETVLGQLDPVVRDAALGEVVRADLLGALAAADLRAPLRGELRPAASRARARTGARAARASPSPCSGAATSRPASRRRRRSAGA